MFKIKDNVVYPGHGVGQIESIETKFILGCNTSFYSIRIYDSGMLILAPVHTIDKIGLRSIMSQSDAQKVRKIMLDTSNEDFSKLWSVRYREYMEKVRTGSPFELAELVRDLALKKRDSELSFGERKMLDNAKALLMRELSLVKGLAVVS